MNLPIWQIDAFASKPLQGNPAAVIPLEAFPGTALMQAIAGENNLSETAFLVKTAPGHYNLRWFTPQVEVPLCGHATLASAYVVFNDLEPGLHEIAFQTHSGTLTVTRGAHGLIAMSLPSDRMEPYDEPGLAARIAGALNAPRPSHILRGKNLMGVWDDAAVIRGLGGAGQIANVLIDAQLGGFIATAPGDQGYDCVSRYFAPTKGIPEDPVTGGAHCAITPYWAERLGKADLRARQASPRGGDLLCTDAGARTILSGTGALYLRGEIRL